MSEPGRKMATYTEAEDAALNVIEARQQNCSHPASAIETLLEDAGEGREVASGQFHCRLCQATLEEEWNEDGPYLVLARS